MRYKTWILVVSVVVLATAVSFFTHVALQEWSTAWFVRNSDYMRSLQIIRPPYPTYIVTVAGVLQLLPMAAQFALCTLAWISLPFTERAAKAGTIVLLSLLANDVIRTDIMTMLVGNPLAVTLISRADSLVPKLLTAAIFATGLAIWNPTRAALERAQ